MNDQVILHELTVIFRQVFDDPRIALTLDTIVAHVEGWDSFSNVTLIVAIETHFKIKFQSAEVEELRNISDFVKSIVRKLEQKNI